MGPGPKNIISFGSPWESIKEAMATLLINKARFPVSEVVFTAKIFFIILFYKKLKNICCELLVVGLGSGIENRFGFQQFSSRFNGFFIIACNGKPDMFALCISRCGYYHFAIGKQLL